MNIQFVSPGWFQYPRKHLTGDPSSDIFHRSDKCLDNSAANTRITHKIYIPMSILKLVILSISDELRQMRIYLVLFLAVVLSFFLLLKHQNLHF